MLLVQASRPGPWRGWHSMSLPTNGSPTSGAWKGPSWMRSVVTGGQTGHAMDDIGATTDRRGYVFVQGKRHLTLGRDPESVAVGWDRAIRRVQDLDEVFR